MVTAWRLTTATLGAVMMMVALSLLLAPMGVHGPLFGLLLVGAGLLGAKWGYRCRG